MKLAIILISCALPVFCQQQTGSVPIYHVMVIQRTVKAVNYQYRSEPTPIDFRGTVLLPKGKGEAVVESKRGRTQIDAKFENLGNPQKFGLEYLTYVLWALTPDGRPHNLGEVVPGPHDKATLRVTTDMQAFAMIVTAEPYSAVREPGNVVVLENVIRPDTEGKIEEVDAKYELLPRGLYSWNEPHQLEAAISNTPKVSMRQYEAISELYQAQNALGIARNAGAVRYAPNTFGKAQQLLAQAQQLQASKQDPSSVVEAARESAETAEDARVIATKRSTDAKIAEAKAEAMRAQQVTAEANAQAQKAQSEARAAQAQADADRATRQLAQAEAAAARQQAARAQAALQAEHERVVLQQQQLHQQNSAEQKTELRMKVLEQLNGVLPSLDTGRGLVATVAGAGFTGTLLKPSSSEQVAQIAFILARDPGLHVSVEGFTSGPDTTGLSQQRADAVRQVLIGNGLPADRVLARGLGDSRLLVSNRTAAGREENERVELVISGDPIGNLPSWEHPYSLSLTVSPTHR